MARHTLDRMRHAGFDVEVGPPYFGFLREVLVFLVAIADRIAYARLAAEQRVEFTGALVHHLARILQDSEDDLLGPAPAGEPSNGDSSSTWSTSSPATTPSSAPTRRCRRRAGFHPDFAFVRYLGSRLEPLLPEKDRRWVLDQVMAVEAPEAVAMVQRSCSDLFDRRRAPRGALA